MTTSGERPGLERIASGLAVAGRRVRGVLLGLALAIALLPVSPAAAEDALDGVLEVESAFISLDRGVYELHARVRYPANEQTAAALRDGVSLTYDLEVEVSRWRRWWLDDGITSLRLRRELSYHTVTERYVVRDLQSGAPIGGRAAASGTEQVSFATLEEALASLGAVDGWPILVASQVPLDGDYEVRVRAGVRRGRLTDALRVIVFWSDDWSRQSEWYTWSLPR
jgi:hypothetical protein